MKPSREEAIAAIRTLIKFIGDDPNREGIVKTPERVIRSYSEFFSGYGEDPEEILSTTFSEVNGYDEIIILKNSEFVSYCEHHMVPIIGTATVAYLPDKKVVGISKLARIVDVYAKRLQIQEKMTAEISNAINDILKPKGVAVIIEANHQCLSTRGVGKKDAIMQTSRMLGCFKHDQAMRQELLALIK